MMSNDKVAATFHPPANECPECRQGKHGNCNGDSWDNEVDDFVDCACAARSHGYHSYTGGNRA